MAIEDHLLTIGLIAAGLQVVGYLVYYRKTIKGEVAPNPLTWFMFGYGTALLFFLELDKDATLPELLLPLACAVCGVAIAIHIWKTAFLQAKAEKPNLRLTRFWPEQWSLRHLSDWDAISLASDYVITVGYLLAWAFTLLAFFPEVHREKAALIFLLFSNISTIPGFIPILKETWKCPEYEHWLPWTIWTIAYTLLFVVTYNDSTVPMPDSWDIRTWKPEFTSWVGLLSYPASNMVLHALVALFALPHRQRKHLTTMKFPCE